MTMKDAHAAAGTLWSIGVIRSDISVRRDAPKQGAEGAPDVWLDVNPLVAAGLMGIKAGDELIVACRLCRTRCSRPVPSTAPTGSSARSTSRSRC